MAALHFLEKSAQKFLGAQKLFVRKKLFELH